MSDIKWVEVESSNIVAIGTAQHDIDYGYELWVRFKGGTEYVYHDVPTQVVVNFLVADSHGKYLNEHIKGKYKYEKV